MPVRGFFLLLYDLSRNIALRPPQSRFKNSAAHCFFNVLLSVWLSDEIRFLVFAISLAGLQKSFLGGGGGDGTESILPK